MTIEERIEKLHQAIRLAKDNPCHVPSGPQGGQFCETKDGDSVSNKAAATVSTIEGDKPKWQVDSKRTAGSDDKYYKRAKIPGQLRQGWYGVSVRPDGSWRATNNSAQGSHVGTFTRTVEIGTGSDADALRAFLPRMKPAW